MRSFRTLRTSARRRLSIVQQRAESLRESSKSIDGLRVYLLHQIEFARAGICRTDSASGAAAPYPSQSLGSGQMLAVRRPCAQDSGQLPRRHRTCGYGEPGVVLER